MSLTETKDLDTPATTIARFWRNHKHRTLGRLITIFNRIGLNVENIRRIG